MVGIVIDETTPIITSAISTSANVNAFILKIFTLLILIDIILHLII